MNIQSVINNNLTTPNSKYSAGKYASWNQTSIQNKGKVGEEVAEAILVSNGHLVGHRTSSEHDKVVDGKRCLLYTSPSPRD